MYLSNLKQWRRIIIMVIGCLSIAQAGSITTLGIAYAAAQRVEEFSHFKIIGACVWLLHTPVGIPYIAVTPELEEYIPDLVVSSFNNEKDNPWIEARTAFDQAGYAAGNAEAIAATGMSLTNAPTVDVNKQREANSIQVKYVDVIGNPYPLKYFPFPHLRVDTTSFFPYYFSMTDTLGRLGIAEALRPESANLFSYFIGKGFADNWGYEFPRDLIVTQFGDYQSSLMAAQQAADIVTNKHWLHTAKGTSDSCGINCAVANVIEEQDDSHEIWQEVYPYNKHIHIGEHDDSTTGQALGQDDEAAGGGNYVFVVWRHYKGCVQHPGQLVWETVNVPDTKKR